MGISNPGKSNRALFCPCSRALWPAVGCSDFAAAAAIGWRLGRPETELRVRLPEPASGKAGPRAGNWTLAGGLVGVVASRLAMVGRRRHWHG